MGHEWTHMTVDGFGEGETDFAQLLAGSDQAVRDELDSQVMSPLVSGMPGGVILVITGHADRVDSGGDHASLLRQEAAASYERAQSAQAAILVKLREDWLYSDPQTWDDLPEIANFTEARGAIDLVVEPASEEDRRRNRRVSLGVCRFWQDS